MRRFVEGTDRATKPRYFLNCLEDWICEDNPVRANRCLLSTKLDLAELGFGGVDPEANRTGPSYHPSVTG